MERELSPSPVPTQVEVALISDRKRLPGEERRAQLIEVSQPLFAEHGYHHISMDDIAFAAQVTKPVLYKHFPSKYDLYLAVIADRAQALVASARFELRATAKEADSGFATVKAVINSYIHFVQDCGNNATILLESDVSKDPYIREQLSAPHVDIAQEIVENVPALSRLTPDDALAIAMTVTSIARSTALGLLRSTDKLALFDEEASSLLARFTWHGISGLTSEDS